MTMAEAQQQQNPESPSTDVPRWTLQNAFYAAGLAAIIVGGIYFGEPILMPIALAVLLAFALAPLVARLRAFGLGRAPSVLVTAVLALFVIGALGTYIATEFAVLVHDLPRYERNIAGKINSLRSDAEGNSLFATASAVLQRLDNDLTAAEKSPAKVTTSQPKPLLVEVTSQQDSPLHIVQTVVGPLLDPLATIFIVFIFVLFILFQKDDLRDRFIRLAG